MINNLFFLNQWISLTSIRLANGTVDLIDAREIAPSAATQDMYLKNPSSSSRGPLSIAVPGELKGLERMWRLYGSGNITWARLLQPIIDLAVNGFPVSPYMALQIQSASKSLPRGNYSGLMNLLMPNGIPLLEAVNNYTNPKLAETFTQFLQEGTFESFYTGTIAQKLVSDLSSYGAILTLADFANYSITVS